MRPPLSNPPISDGEAKALFALLDAAEVEGRLLNSNTERTWREVKDRLAGADYHAEGPLMWDLVDKLERSRALDGSWIQDRWRTIQTQATRAKALTKDPFFF
jgi:hypothetical protein